MVAKTDFSEQEWKLVSMAPQTAAMVVIVASPSGPVGAMKEIVAFTKLIAEAIQAPSGNALIDAVAADFKEMVDRKEKPEQPQMSKDPKEVIAQSLQACRDLDALLAQKAPDEAEGYKQWVYKAAELSSEASKEGGFMGVGGERVNDAERAWLKEISKALGLPG